jgi:hypothetical protein
MQKPWLLPVESRFRILDIGNDLSPKSIRQIGANKQNPKKALAVEDNSYIDEWQVSREQEQDFDEVPSSRPDERNLLRKRQKIIKDLKIQ